MLAAIKALTFWAARLASLADKFWLMLNSLVRHRRNPTAMKVIHGANINESIRINFLNNFDEMWHLAANEAAMQNRHFAIAPLAFRHGASEMRFMQFLCDFFAQF